MSPQDQAPRKAVGRPIGVVLVSPMAGALAQMNDLVSNEPDMEVYVRSDSADRALEAMQRLPHRLGVVVVVALGLGGEHDSFWLIRSIRETYPTLPVLACGTDVDEATISWALFTGADGFVALEVEPAEFVNALRRVAQRELILQGLPSGWMAREDDLAAPVIVLPGASGPEDDEPPPATASSREADLTLVLPAGGGEAIAVKEQGEVVLADGRQPSRRSPSGSRIGRIFARRHRGEEQSVAELDDFPDPEEAG